LVFASPVFLFAFLPLMLAAYCAVPRAARNPVLLAGSVVFYLWGEGLGLALVVASVLANWGFGLAIGATEGILRRRWLAAAVTLNLGTLAVFKYANFASANLDAVAKTLGFAGLAATSIPLPLGISFFTFHAISYVVDVYKRNARAERRLADFALYILLFPQLIAGPIIRWRDIAVQFGQRTHRLADVAYGVRRFVLGLGKKVLIANTLGQVADRVFALPAGELTMPLAWLGLVCYTLQIYFDFSGYSDMAIGLMRMFGFRILENFNLPYIAQSVREFWRRWHISLSNWFRDYLYVPLGGNRRGKARAWGNLAVVFLLCGLWHGASWPFVVWGAWHGFFLVVERAGFDRVLARIGRLRHAYALAAVMGGWVLFRCETLPQAGSYFAALAGWADGDPGRQPLLQHLDPLIATTLAAALLGATALPRRIGALRDTVASGGRLRSALALGADLAWLTAVGIGAGAWLAAGTYNPFIYFRF
jgi:alginate O-acetyltransferase complex protein AlgI